MQVDFLKWNCYLNLIVKFFNPFLWILAEVMKLYSWFMNILSLRTLYIQLADQLFDKDWEEAISSFFVQLF